MYSFSYDPDRLLLTIVQTGYWSLPDFHAYEREYLAQHDRILRHSRFYRVLADCRDYPVQSVEIGEGFSRLFARLTQGNPGRYAILTASTLNKMQAKRAIPQASVQVFSDRDEAMAWLFEDEDLPG